MRLKIINESKMKLIIKGAIGAENRPYEIVEIPQIMLHGTSDLSTKGIMTFGFDINSHVTINKKLANWSAHRAVTRFGGNPVIVTIDTSKLEDFTFEGTFIDARTIKPIPPNAIAKIEKSKMKSNSPQLNTMKKKNKHIGKQSYHEE